MRHRKNDNAITAHHPGWLPRDLQSSEGALALQDALFEGNPHMVLIIGTDGRIVGANSGAIAGFGYPRRELQGQPLDLLLPMADRQRHAAHMLQYMKNPTVREMGSGMDLKARDSLGNEFPADILLWPIAVGSQTYVVAVCQRLDAALARSQMQMHAMVESVRDCAFNLLDAEGRILTWNEGCVRFYDMTGSKALGQNLSILFTAEEVAAGEPERQMKIASQSADALQTAGWRTAPNGATMWVEGEFTATRELSGQITGFIRVMRDMTLHKRAEEKMREARAVQKKCTTNLSKRVAQRTRQLESSVEELRAKNEEIEAFVTIVSHDLSEKEVLLRELYHRVKNNLQVVQSLLKMGARSVRSSDAREAIETAVQRVHVMAMVHQRLYQMPDLMNLSLPAYLRDVIDGAIDSFCEQPDQVELQLQADEFPLSLDLAIPFGLLANELVSNCLKHGFPHGRQGKIRVSTQSIPGAMRFIVHDDGIGLPEHFNPAESSSMGLKLAASLAHQLGGSLEFTSRDGCRVQADLTRLCSQTQAHNSSVALHPQTVSDRQAGPPSQLGTFQSLSMNLPLPSL